MCACVCLCVYDIVCVCMCVCVCVRRLMRVVWVQVPRCNRGRACCDGPHVHHLPRRYGGRQEGTVPSPVSPRGRGRPSGCRPLSRRSRVVCTHHVSSHSRARPPGTDRGRVRCACGVRAVGAAAAVWPYFPHALLAHVARAAADLPDLPHQRAQRTRTPCGGSWSRSRCSWGRWRRRRTGPEPPPSARYVPTPTLSLSHRAYSN
jgi:hypothetical protein